ncbi:MAG TPA: invasin domain 3-containing protein [Longimicrobium sp.]|jgi:hypothetical protein
MMRRFSLKAAVLAGVLLLGALIPALAQQRDPGLVGDVNGDGRITSADALAVYAYLAGRPIPATFDVPGRGDADGDGQITRADAELIMRVAVGQASGDRPVGKPVVPGTAPAEGPLRLQCVANTRSATVRCSEPGAPAPAGAQGDRIYYGGQHVNVSLITDNVTVAADTFAFDMRVKNLIGQAIGTHDGVAMDSVKVFFDAEPRNTSATPNNGTVTAVNHDGAQPFITSEPQKYFSYGEIIQPQGTSAVRRWKLRRDAAVESFTFFLWVSSPVQHPNGWVDVYPDSAEISAGATLQLTDTVRNRLGRPVGGTVTWSSANPAVATVSTNGLVTGVADGTVVITGSTPNRSSGTMTLTVRTASADSSTITASPATLPVRDTSGITVQLRSANGTPITRSGGTVVLNASGGTLTAVTDNNNGTYTAKLTSATVGVVRVSGTLNGTALADTADVTFTAGAAAGYVVTSSASSVAAGSPVTITAQTVDADSNAVAAGGTVVNWTSTNGGSFASAASTTDSAGTATVVFTTSTTAGVTHTVTATDSLNRTGTSGNIVTQVGAAAKLAITQQPTNTAAGSSISPAVTVAIQDANGNVVTTAADSVSVSIGTNPAGGTLSGTTTVAAVNGVATFSNLSLDKAGTGYTLAFASGGLTGATSSAFNVTAGAAAKLVLVTQPSDSVQSGAAFPRQPVVQLQDANGNPVAQAGVSVTAAIASGGGTLGGTATINTNASGTATFTDLSITGTVGDRTLSFSATGLTGATSNTVSVAAGAASQLIFSVQPSNTAAGAAITPAVQVTVTDASGNLVTGYADSVTVAIGTNPSSGTLSGTKRVVAVNGVATFSDLSIDKSGTGYTLGASSGSLTGTSAAFNVTAGAASHNTSTITANPTSIVADGASTSTITVQLKDANGNNLTASGGTVLIETSSGTMSATTDNNDGTYTATLTSGTVVANTVQITAKLDSFNLANTTTVAFTPGAPASYVVLRSEINPVAGATVTITAQLVDANGNAVPVANRTVTWSSTNGGSFATPTSQTMSTGEATVVFTTSTTAGTVHTVTATDGDGVTGTSGPITTQVGAAAKLGFVQQPTNTVAGASITPAVTVAIQDANGNTVTTATDGVTIAIGNNPGSGTLGGTVTVGAVDGIATFPNLSINKAGTGYTLAASATGLTGATSGAFDITPGAPAALAFTVQPSNVVASAPITPAVQVSIVDANGNLVTTATDNVTLAIGTNPSSGTLSGTTTVAAVNGVATFSNLSINAVGTGYTLAATSGSLTGTTSTAFNVTHGPLHHFRIDSIGAQLDDTPFNVRVTAQDEFNNTVTSFTGTVGFTSTPSGAITAGATSGAFTAGVLTSHAITFGTPGSFTLTATNTAGAQAGTSNSFEVQASPTAVNEGPASNSVPGQPFHAFYSTAGNPQTYTLAAPGLLSNDNLGFPAATITSFGADSLGGSVTTHAAGSTVSPLPGTGRTTGSLSVGADGSVTFTPPDGFTGNYVFRYRLTNARGFSDGQVTIAVGARPSAVNDTYSPQLVGNVPVNTATSTQFRVTTNDTGDGKVLAITGQSNGTATLNADSTFTFRPNAGYNGPASFTYTVTNGFGTSAAATVSLTVGTPIWFINSAAAAGDGRYDAPFNSLSSFAAINNGTGNNPAANDNIFLYAGTYAGPVTLLNGQKLIGQRATASLSSIAGVTWPADSGAEPSMSSASALDVTAAGGTAVTLANVGSATAANNTLRGFNFGNVTATGTALAGTSFGALGISEVGINTNGRALNLTTGTLEGSLTGVTSTGGAGNIALSGVRTTGTFSFGSGALSGATSDALAVTGASTGSFTYGGTIAGGAGAAVNVGGGTSTLALSGNVSQGNNFALLNVTGGHSGTLTMTGQLSATNGTGLQFSDADGSYNLDGVQASSVLNGGDAGIDILAGSAGTFTFGTNLAISNPSGTAVYVHASSPTLVVKGAVTQGAAKRGIYLQDNTGGTSTFSGVLALNTTTQNAFEATHTSLAGTVIASNAANVLSTTTGTALRVNNVNIGVGGLVFRSVSANGAPNGIVLNNTGTTAGLTVSGTGSAGTGGTIQNTSISGINLTSAQNISLSWMNLTNANSTDAGGSGVCDGTTNTLCNGAIKLNGVRSVLLDRIAISGAAEQGINGTNVTGLTLSNSTISGAGNEVNESGIYIFGLFGTTAAGTANSITNTTVTGSGSANHNVFIRNSTATNAAPGAPDRLLISSSSFINPGSPAVNAGPSDGITVSLRSTANFQTVVQNSTFTQDVLANGTDGIQVDAGDNSFSDVSITGSSFGGTAGWNQAPINLSGSGNHTTTFSVTSNPLIKGGVGNGVNVISNGGGLMRGTIASNTNITSSQGNNNGIGIAIEASGFPTGGSDGRAIVDVNGNTVTAYAIGMRGTTRGQGRSAAADLTIRNNTVTAGGTFPAYGLLLTAGNADNQNTTRTCVNLTNNQITATAGGIVDYGLEQWNTGTFQIQGLTGSGTDPNNVKNFVSSRDIGGATVDAVVGSTVNYTSATCATP